MIAHVFFTLHRTLIDPRRLHDCTHAATARIMSARYGESPAVWASARERILADWDSYYADLDLGGDEGLAHLYEGLFRTTRAMFRLAGVTEPNHADLTALSRDLPTLAAQGCDAHYPDAVATIRALHDAGLTLGVAAHSLSAQARAMLGDLADLFTTFACQDTTGHFVIDADFLRHALIGVTPEHALLVTDSRPAIQSAQSLGMHTAQVVRGTSPPPRSPATWMLCDDLRPLVGLILTSR